MFRGDSGEAGLSLRIDFFTSKDAHNNCNYFSSAGKNQQTVQSFRFEWK